MISDIQAYGAIVAVTILGLLGAIVSGFAAACLFEYVMGLRSKYRRGYWS